VPRNRNFRNPSWFYSRQLRGSVEHQLFQRKRDANATALCDRRAQQRRSPRDVVCQAMEKKKKKERVILYQK
jgi:hypothetical protein